jgi:uncharacterized protein (UPF0297 family)
MSTELYDAKQLADEIHEIAKVPPDLNEHIYGMTLQMIEHLIGAMDQYGLTMNEQRTKMGRKKDELITELVRLRDEGILISGDPGQPIKRVQYDMGKINVRR